MKTFFKDNDKIIINSMDYTESIVGKEFIHKVETSNVKIEQRYDVNDDFDGLVITLENKEPQPEPTPGTDLKWVNALVYDRSNNVILNQISFAGEVGTDILFNEEDLFDHSLFNVVLTSFPELKFVEGPILTIFYVVEPITDVVTDPDDITGSEDGEESTEGSESVDASTPTE